MVKAQLTKLNNTKYNGLFLWLTKSFNRVILTARRCKVQSGSDAGMCRLFGPRGGGGPRKFRDQHSDSRFLDFLAHFSPHHNSSRHLQKGIAKQRKVKKKRSISGPSKPGPVTLHICIEHGLDIFKSGVSAKVGQVRRTVLSD